MSSFISRSALLAVATIAATAPLAAQTRSTVSSAALDAMIAGRPADSRAVVTNALSSSQAVAIAGRMGMNSTELTARIAALDDAKAKQLSDQILAGGSSTVVISTTAVIIILLVLILLTH